MNKNPYLITISHFKKSKTSSYFCEMIKSFFSPSKYSKEEHFSTLKDHKHQHYNTIMC